MAAERVPVDVAVGVLLDTSGRFLLTSRPTGKVYAGYWEFPGGKLESGETVHQALKRELHEELGITIMSSQPSRATVCFGSLETIRWFVLWTASPPVSVSEPPRRLPCSSGVSVSP